MAIAVQPGVGARAGGVANDRMAEWQACQLDGSNMLALGLSQTNVEPQACNQAAAPATGSVYVYVCVCVKGVPVAWAEEGRGLRPVAAHKCQLPRCE